MANRLNVILEGGSGTVSLSPSPDETGLYATGTTVSVTIVPDSGFNFIEWVLTRRGQTPEVLGSSLVVIVKMGRSDVLLKAVLESEELVEFNYGLRLVSEYKDINYKKTRFIIEQKNYEGAFEEVLIDSLKYSFGVTDSEPIETFIKSSVSWNYVVENNNINLDFLLTSDPREFRVKYYRGYVSDLEYDHVWIGYCKTSFIERPEYQSTYKIGFVATDGLSDFGGYKVNLARLDFTNAMTVIASLLKQTFRNPLPIKETARVFETRMTSIETSSVFTQFTINQDFIYADEVRFVAQDDLIVFNPTKKVLEVLEGILKSFMCRLFLWNGYWHIVRVMEYAEDEIIVNNFTTDGVYESTEVVSNNQEFECIGNPVRLGENDYTEFNTVLNLGSINRPENRSIIEEDFSNLRWYAPGRRPGSANGVLKAWFYTEAVQADGVKNSEVARVERVNTVGANPQDFVRIWCTANGISDPRLSSIDWLAIEYNSVTKNADILAFSFKFQITRLNNSIREVPQTGSHLVAVQVKINNFYLSWDGTNLFEWVNTETKILIPAENTGVFNVFVTPEIEVPETGLVELSLFQLITVPGRGARHTYAVDFDDINLSIVRNDSLSYSKIRAKALTGVQYSNVYPAYETYLGDALTNLSSAAVVLKLPGSPVSENWSREDANESIPLLGVLLQDLVNIFGKNNYTISARVVEKYYYQLNLSKNIVYKNKKNVILAADLDDRTTVWDFQFYELTSVDDVPTGPVITWEVRQFGLGPDFINAGTSIRVNGSIVVEASESDIGTFNVNEGDEIVIVGYCSDFDLSSSAPSVIPKLELYIDDVLIRSVTLVDSTSARNSIFHRLTVGSSDLNILILAQAYG